LLLSIIIPVRNEINYIEKSFISIIKAVRKISYEIIFVDGKSRDGTYEWLERKIDDYSNCTLITNEKKYVNFGFNLAYPKTIGQYVARLDGHTIYPEKYFRNAIEILNNDIADIVGGPAIHIGKTWKGDTIAKCMMHPFGVGGSNFRTSHTRMFVDTVPFPIYKRYVLDDVGLYDEKLIRNQDDELNYRCRSKGYKILMHPKLKTKYFVRENLRGLCSQYFNYGIFKPIVFKKVPYGKRWYHYVPPIFCILISITFLLVKLHWIFILPIILYIFFCLIFSIYIQQTIMSKFFSIFVFPSLHFSYGFGYLFGFVRLLKEKVW